MEERGNKTARYKIIPEADGNRYRFFCEASGAALCTTKPLQAASPEKELLLAWEQEGKQHFNRCHKCGKWICDAMYNADTLDCVDCSPWENPPHFCPSCGNAVPENDKFCRKCGVRLMYGGDTNGKAV